MQTRKGNGVDTIPEAQRVANRVTDWLETLEGTVASPVVVKIGRTIYSGASFSQRRQPDPGTAAYQSGERYYNHGGMYLLGELPYAYRRKSTTAFKTPIGRFPWYVAGWYDLKVPNEWHPFGQMFLLQMDKTNVTTDIDGNPYRTVRMDLIG